MTNPVTTESRALETERFATSNSLLPLSLIVLLPLGAIAVQVALELQGLANAIYKLCFLVPPVLYCRAHGIRIIRDILKPQHWRRGLGVSIALGLGAIVIFWSAYALLGELLLDKEKIRQSIGRQFVVNAETVLLVAPFTIFLNSLLEEFFYRGFSFGLLVRRHRLLGYLLPTSVFTTQHTLFFWNWLEWIPFTVAAVGLAVFALALQRLYERTDTIVAPWIVHIFGDVAMMGIAVGMLWWGW